MTQARFAPQRCRNLLTRCAIGAIRCLAALLLLLGPATALTLEPSATRSEQGFDVFAFVTVDTNWQEKWQTPRSTTPIFDTRSNVSPGQTITLLILFRGAEMNEKGINLACDVKIIAPDGAVLGELPPTPCGQGKVPNPKTDFYMATRNVEILLTDDFPRGPLVFLVGVKDNLRDVHLPLALAVNVVDAKQ
ncbi:hypothetical protein [Labrenzia sp. VG12]|uniref:hypothetical protein n=1 Tax=Labrenzia sp. VG12 TaxID=2021862 RepID=UPI000B8C5ADC|nr:hypothetical protein [Labrenzia sp. VG12]ASP32867.1 hypothetical protein CHH27_06080 [Labrenzia sp. VG12]